jgi:hypothetical protein
MVKVEGFVSSDSVSIMTTPWRALDIEMRAITIASSMGYVASTANSNKTG